MNMNVNIPTPQAAAIAIGAQRGDDEAGGEIVVAAVKWFREDKGYGFVELPEGGGDAFLHAKVLRNAGLDSFRPAMLRIMVEAGARGLQVGRVLDVDVSTSSMPSPSARAPRT